ncbi:MAG TPA: PBP1A family penicillin-binding protein [Rhizomicrobium sp.]|nr:PBP1A family penicillin-binding protein [Rhizomicrobium sp.]
MTGKGILKKLQAVRLYAKRPEPGFVRVASIAIAIVAIPITLIWLVPAFLVFSAPEIDTSQDLYSMNRPVAFTFLDSQGHIAGHRGAIVGERLRLDEMPGYLPAAFIAMEDRSFYQNEGIDVRGLLRAMWMNFRAGHVVAGGSTITQQTAKIVFLSPKRTFARKYEELVDAAALQKSLNKKQILELYLNRIYLGSGAYGVDGAAHVYFGKSARDLTLPEAAMLATLTRAPSAFSPRRDLPAAQDRADSVLRAMVETHAVTKEQAAEAIAHPAVITDGTLVDARNFFLDTAGEEALRLVDANGAQHSADLIVHTTLDPALEDAARHALARTLNAKGRHARAHEGAIVVMRTDGAVPALIGGRDYDSSAFNRATQAKRQPGSAFKPFVYLAALENGMSPFDTRDDSPIDINGWSPTNYNGQSYGTVTLADALAHSINTVTAGLAQDVGIDKVIDAAHRCGITSPLQANPSLALGTSDVTPLELTTAYATFASGGLRVAPYFVTAVEDNAHHLLYQRRPAPEPRAIATNVDRDLTMMLYGVITEGTGRSAALPGREAAGKTGTTQDYRDAWFVGFTPDYVTGVWVGNDNNSPMRNVTGGTLPAAIWKDVMVAAESGLPPKALDKSPSVPPVDTETETASTNDETATPDTSTSGDDESGPAGTTEPDTQSAPARTLKSEHRSFWDWLTGGGSDNTDTQQQPRRETQNQLPPPHREIVNEPPPPRDENSDEPQQRVERYPPRVVVGPPPDRSAPGAGYPPDESNTDEPPVRDPDDETGPPPVRDPNSRPPVRDPDSPPPIVHRRYLPPPPPPPPPPDDDNGDGN